MKIENHEKVEFLMREIQTLKRIIGDEKSDHFGIWEQREIKCLSSDKMLKTIIRNKIKAMEQEIETL